MSTATIFRPGDPVPMFTAPSSVNAKFNFETLAGMYVVLGFFGSATSELAQKAMAAVMARKDMFDDVRACFFGISANPDDYKEKRLKQVIPGIRYFWDFDLNIGRQFRAVDSDSGPGEKISYRQFWLILDPMLRVLAQIPLEHADAALDFVAGLPPTNLHGGMEIPAPVLILPRVFEPDYCRHLIALYEKNGGTDSGFMQDVDGKTVGVINHSFKRRADYYINDEPTLFATKARIERRLLPEIQKAFHIEITRMERYLVCRYDSDPGGYFKPHRDNTTKGTAHRRFAVTINLNADEYEGGDLRFPEFGSRTYRAPTGGAVVFSCSLMHEAQPVTKGSRYAFLPFLYDESGAKTRAENNKFLGEGIAQYHGVKEETKAS